MWTQNISSFLTIFSSFFGGGDVDCCVWSMWLCMGDLYGNFLFFKLR